MAKGGMERAVHDLSKELHASDIILLWNTLLLY